MSSPWLSVTHGSCPAARSNSGHRHPTCWCWWGWRYCCSCSDGARTTPVGAAGALLGVADRAGMQYAMFLAGAAVAAGAGAQDAAAAEPRRSASRCGQGWWQMTPRQAPSALWAGYMDSQGELPLQAAPPGHAWAGAAVAAQVSSCGVRRAPAGMLGVLAAGRIMLTRHLPSLGRSGGGRLEAQTSRCGSTASGGCQPGRVPPPTTAQMASARCQGVAPGSRAPGLQRAGIQRALPCGS